MTNPSSPVFRVADLSQNRPTRFEVNPAAEEMSAIAEQLGLLGLRKLRFTGQIVAEGQRDWRLVAELGATVVQPCVLSLEPVTTRIDDSVTRRFLAQMPDDEDTEEEEIEMPEDDSIEPLGKMIDPSTVMIEALSLALPLYPRADGAALGDAAFTEPGKEALKDEDLKPFAGLAALRDKLTGDDTAEG
ncbi:DUF177 domain-containing protein [Thalassovita sp.]|uniref:YceD family protein n=1 Tax=Thalassovita sp. TaxID=1979401 RepID=UPI0028810146|nr:DUF177 domain-containing protein [Thalassovita sp.]MDF1801283.1 DUF177 domain-containing protein [Thalassovita sp.]